MDGASTSAFFTNPGTSLALAFAALLIVISYTLITINFIVTLVESYLVVSVGFIFLGFGGSRWTAPYTERYIGLAVSIGIKIVLLYCLIAAGFDLSLGWLNEAQGISTSARPAMTAFDVMGGALIFMMCCWQIPKLFAAVIGGSPALTGGDLIATTAVVGGAALAAGRVAVAGVTALAGVGAGAAAGAGSAGGAGGTGSKTTTAVASVGTVGANSSAGDSVSPPSSPSSGFAGNGVAERRQPDPPSSGLRPSISSALSSIGGESLEGSGFETERPQRGFAHMSVTASEQTSAAGPSASPLAVRGGTSGDGEGVAPSNLTSPDSSGIVPDVAPVGSAGPASPQQPPAIRQNPLTRAVDQVRGLRRRLRSLPSDAAPHATPPRIPIDHEE